VVLTVLVVLVNFAKRTGSSTPDRTGSPVAPVRDIGRADATWAVRPVTDTFGPGPGAEDGA
jgi:hypothetical protein